MDRGRDKDADTTQLVVDFCLQFASGINALFRNFTNLVQILVLPQWSKYQRRAYFIIALQVFTSDVGMLTIAKVLKNQYDVDNFMLLLALGSIAPFLQCMYVLWTNIPCPNIANVISNGLLLFTLVLLILLGAGSYSDVWTIFGYVGVLWPWLVLASMVSRLYIERSNGRNPFSPVRELPILGFMSAAAYIMMLLSVKEITVTDCVSLIFLDAVLAALLCSLFLGKQRRILHLYHVKAYIALLGFFALYMFGDVGNGELQIQGPSLNHLMFVGARFLIILRSVIVKWNYAAFYGSEAPLTPPDDERLFRNGPLPRKHRFQSFPAPTLLTLDCIFDSGLRDSELHGMGILGTQDLYMLTDSTYILPTACMCCWLLERSTLQYGVFPESYGEDDSSLGTSAVDVVLASASEPATTVEGESSGTDTVLIIALVILFGLARLASPYANSMALYDRASSIHAWKYQPIITVMPYFLIDVAFLNGQLSKFQIVMVLLLTASLAHYRENLWGKFKRKYLLLCTQESHFYQPSALRNLQRRTLQEFLEQTSTDDYELMLFETTMRHGANIRELARDLSIKVWDPAPTATASWKLAFSVVTRSIRRSKLLREQKKAMKAEIQRWLEKMVLDMVDRAVDTAAGHGARLRGAGALNDVLSKRRAIRRLRELAERRRTLRQRRKTGQLALAPMQLATTSGVLRSIHDLAPLSQTSGAPPKYMLEEQAAARADRAAAQMSMSLTSRGFAAGTGSGSATMEEPHGGEASPLLSMPGEPMDISPRSNATTAVSLEATLKSQKSETWDGRPRGVYAMDGWPGDADRAILTGSVVLAWGDPRRGQLGPDAKNNARGSVGVATIVEDMRGTDPVQVEAAGMCSFVVGARGHVWGFGSNRSMELGCRKEVTQLQAPQRIKSIRDHQIVQVASSSSASGQAFTYVVTNTGQVHTFGTSATGGLAQGQDVRNSAPMLLRFTKGVKVKQVALGARHALLLSDEGHVYSAGDNSRGQLGLGQGRKRVKMISSPEPVGGDLETQPVKLLAVGDFHALATLERGGALYSWGANADGQLGLGTAADQDTPQVVRDLQDANLNHLACGARHSLVVSANGGQLWGFGSNTQGQLGLGPNTFIEGQQRSLPALCTALSGQRGLQITQIVSAANHSLVLTKVGEVFAFGDNSYGQLGFPPEGRGADAARGQLRSTAANNGLGPLPLSKGRAAREVDQPRSFAEGVARLWLPARVVGLSLYHVRTLSTGEMHSLALATLNF